MKTAPVTTPRRKPPRRFPRKTSPTVAKPMARALGVDLNTLKQSFRREFGIVSFDGIAGDGVERKNPRYTKQQEERETKDVLS